MTEQAGLVEKACLALDVPFIKTKAEKGKNDSKETKDGGDREQANTEAVHLLFCNSFCEFSSHFQF